MTHVVVPIVEKLRKNIAATFITDGRALWVDPLTPSVDIDECTTAVLSSLVG